MDEAVNQWKTICQTFRAHPTLEWQLFTFRFPSHPSTFVRNSTVVESNKKKRREGRVRRRRRKIKKEKKRRKEVELVNKNRVGLVAKSR